jgi:hypothetical protein
MELTEKLQFMQAVEEAQEQLERSLAALRRAKASCHGEVFEQADVLAKRAYEVKVQVEWLRLVVAGAIDASAGSENGAPRSLPDRRYSLDRRVAGMRRQILAARQGAMPE